jgi:integrase/recombinase XerC
MKQIPSPQLVRIPDPALVQITTLTLENIETPNHSQETLWEEFLRLQLKPRTRQEYGKSIDYFCRSMAPDRSHSVPGGESPTTFLQEFLASTKREAILLVLEWRQRILNEGKASGTINQRISALKSLVEYAGRQDACSFSLSEIKSLKSQSYKDTRGVSVDDYRSILALVDRSTDLGIRDYAILRLLWDLALRREEVVSLDIHSYLPGRLMVKSKGQFDRQSIDLNPQLENALDHWVAIREGLYFQPKDGTDSPSGTLRERDDALFLSCNGRRLAGTDIFRILQGYADAAGVKISPHRVRHSAITAFLDVSEGDMRSAQSLSRHKDPRTLMIYDDNRQGLQGKATQALGDLLD